MGEIAEMMLDGTLCQCCGVYLADIGEEGAGYPGYCEDCEPEPQPVVKAKKIKCKHCDKSVKPIGMHDHIRDAHQKPNYWPKKSI